MDETGLGFEDDEHCLCCASSQMAARTLSNALNERPPVVGRSATYLKVCLAQFGANLANSVSTLFGGLVTYYYEVYQVEKHEAGTRGFAEFLAGDPVAPIDDEELPTIDLDNPNAEYEIDFEAIQREFDERDNWLKFTDDDWDDLDGDDLI